MSQKTKCDACNKTFPSHLIQSVYSTGYEDICPICALDRMNENHGMDRTEFSGEMENQLLHEAHAYLKAGKPRRKR